MLALWEQDHRVGDQGAAILAARPQDRDLYTRLHVLYGYRGQFSSLRAASKPRPLGEGDQARALACLDGHGALVDPTHHADYRWLALRALGCVRLLAAVTGLVAGRCKWLLALSRRLLSLPGPVTRPLITI